MRPEAAADVDQTIAVVEAAFANRLEADLVDALRRSADPQLSLVAESEGEIVGHIFFSPLRIATRVSGRRVPTSRGGLADRIACASYRSAIAVARNHAERAAYQRRLRSLEEPHDPPNNDAPFHRAEAR